MKLIEKLLKTFAPKQCKNYFDMQDIDDDPYQVENALSNEPPMRNASGAFVRVEEKEPWDLHLLTSDAANAAEDETDRHAAACRAVVGSTRRFSGYPASRRCQRRQFKFSPETRLRLAATSQAAFVLPLNVDRPNPENREFKHQDPLAWTQANRKQILSALYTILIGCALQRPQGQVAQTRFKFWWGLIGWPIQYAAGLLNIKLDCTELLRAGKSEDEEAGAASRVMAIFYKRWGVTRFTASQVMLALDAANSMVEESAEQAQELAAAMANWRTSASTS